MSRLESPKEPRMRHTLFILFTCQPIRPPHIKTSLAPPPPQTYHFFKKTHNQIDTEVLTVFKFSQEKKSFLA